MKETKSIPKRKKTACVCDVRVMFVACMCLIFNIYVVCLHGLQVAFIHAKLEFRDELDLFFPNEEMKINAFLFL